MGKYIFPLDFAKYLSFLEVQKNSKVYIRKKEFCSQYVIKTLYGSKFLVSEYIFELVYRCEVADVSKKNFEHIVTVAYLKKQLLKVYRRESCS